MTNSQAALLEADVATVCAEVSRIINHSALRLKGIHRNPNLVKLRSLLGEANKALQYAADILEELAQ